jgi:hypothetical protein
VFEPQTSGRNCRRRSSPFSRRHCALTRTDDIPLRGRCDSSWKPTCVHTPLWLPRPAAAQGEFGATTPQDTRGAARRITVFVSYCHEDARTIERVKVLSYLKDLESDGCEVWSEQDLTTGDDWNEVLLARLGTSHPCSLGDARLPSIEVIAGKSNSENSSIDA